MNSVLTMNWSNRNAFIIGGGASLRGFDWSLLDNEHTIGCNNAFRLGSLICDICIFGDRSFIFTPQRQPRKGFYHELKNSLNPVVSTDKHLKKMPGVSWIEIFERKTKGFATDKLGWNLNTGSTAINLALILGASTVYLLGFDMHLDEEGRPNWHDFVIDKPNKDVYLGMIKSFEKAAPQLKELFPTRSVINVTNNSDLNAFPKINFDEFWNARI